MPDPKKMLVALMERDAPQVLQRARQIKADREAADARRAAEKENEENAAPGRVLGFQEERQVRNDNVIRDWRARSLAAANSGDKQEMERVRRERAAAESSRATDFIGGRDLAIRAQDARERVAAEDKRASEREREQFLNRDSVNYTVRYHVNPDREMYLERDARLGNQGWTYDEYGWHPPSPPTTSAPARPETKEEAEARALRELEADMDRLRERLRGPTLAGAGVRKREGQK